MKTFRLFALAALAFAVPAQSQTRSKRAGPEITYTITVDSATPSRVAVAMSFRNLPDTFRMAMAVHPEYDNGYWRTVGDVEVISPRAPPALTRRVANGTVRGNPAANVTRTDSTLWRVIAPGGSGVISYSVAIRPESRPDSRASWHPFVRETGALVSPVDFLFYLPDFPAARTTLELHAPTGWKVGTGLARATGVQQACVISQQSEQPRTTCSGVTNFAPTTAASLLDSPILLGNLHQWDFTVGRVPHQINYWPLPNAVAFDTAAFASRVAGIAREATAIFGKPPYAEYSFLFQDGAWGALEHGNSVTIGIPSADLATNVNSYLVEIAHEFFHAWNLVALRPAGWGALSYKRTAPTSGLWWSEGVTMYYAYLLPRRIGFPEEGRTRTRQLEEDLGSYFSSPGDTRISPERASMLADAEPWAMGDYESDFYLVGRLIGEGLELVVNDSTNGRHGLDEVMRTLYRKHAESRGFTAADITRAANTVCKCDLTPFFRDHVSGAKALDFNRYLSSLGLSVKLDTIPVADSAGTPFPDTRVWVRASANGRHARLIVFDPNSAWVKAGLHSGDDLISLNKVQVDSMPDLRRAIRTIKLNDVVPVEIFRDGKTQRVNVTVTGYTNVRAKITERPDATRAQIARRERWLTGRLADDET